MVFCTETDAAATPTAETMPPKCYYRDPSNVVHCVVGLLLLVFGVFSLYQDLGCLAMLTAIAVDVYLVILLIGIAVLGDGFKPFRKFLPHRLVALFLAFFLFISLVFSFATIYVTNKEVSQSCSHCNEVSASNIKDQTTVVPLSSHVKRDALYFSLVTMGCNPPSGQLRH